MKCTTPRTVNGHVYVYYWYRMCLFLRYYDWIFNLFWWFGMFCGTFYQHRPEHMTLNVHLWIHNVNALWYAESGIFSYYYCIQLIQLTIPYKTNNEYPSIRWYASKRTIRIHKKQSSRNRKMAQKRETNTEHLQQRRVKPK